MAIKVNILIYRYISIRKFSQNEKYLLNQITKNYPKKSANTNILNNVMHLRDQIRDMQKCEAHFTWSLVIEERNKFFVVNFHTIDFPFSHRLLETVFLRSENWNEIRIFEFMKENGLMISSFAQNN